MIVSERQGPFTLKLLLSQGGGKFTFSEHQFGFSVRSADKYIRALAALALGNRFEAYNLESGERILAGSPREALPQSHLAEWADFFSETTRLCECFNVELQLNRALTEDDARGLDLLRAIMSGSTSSIGQIATTICINAEDEKLLLKACEAELADLVLENPGMRVLVLDTAVTTGPFRITARARLENADEVIQRLGSAEPNAAVQLIWQPVGAVAITRVQAK